MAFSNYKDIGVVLKRFKITYTEANFIGYVFKKCESHLNQLVAA